MVLADSSIVQVNANSRPDLFKALKGGGPNFGKRNPFHTYSIPLLQLLQVLSRATIPRPTPIIKYGTP
jgi:hypothetical protein